MEKMMVSESSSVINIVKRRHWHWKIFRTHDVLTAPKQTSINVYDRDISACLSKAIQALGGFLTNWKNLSSRRHHYSCPPVHIPWESYKEQRGGVLIIV